MPEGVIAAYSGDQHMPVPAPQWDYKNGQKVPFTGEAALSAPVNAPLVRLVATKNCFYTIGDDAAEAKNEAGNAYLPMEQNWAETITPGQYISVLSDGTDGVLFIIPAVTEGGGS
jgi:hypothetical protein